MDFSAFLRALRRSWLAALLLFELAIFASLVYARHTIQPTAEATVAVRDPVTARPGYSAAQVTFDAIVESRRLSERVALRLGKDIRSVESALSAKVVPAASGFNISPLYAVRGKGATEDAALGLVNTAVEEARALYLELNDVKADEVTSALASQTAEAETARAEAQAAYDGFAAANDTRDLQARLETESARARTLQDQVATASADLAATRAVGPPEAAAALNKRLVEYQRQLADAEGERDRLRGLAAQDADLTAQLARAKVKVDQLNDLEKQEVLSQILPLQTQVKALDDARIQSQTLMKILIYGVGFLLGLLAAASAIYTRHLVEARTETPDSISDGFGAPILARIPSRAFQGAFR